MIIDLCCGQGRFPGEEVISIDFDKKHKPTIQADIRHLPLKSKIKPKLLHASPPCTYISKARRWRWGYNLQGIAESFKLIASCYEAALYLEAQNFSLEQPAGLEEYLGRKVTFRYPKYDIKTCKTNFYLSWKATKRAIIPQDVRQKILQEITNQ